MTDSPNQVGRHVRNLVAFAERNRGWHTAATDRTTQRALAAAVRRGYVRTNAHGQFCFNYPTTIEDKNHA